MAGRFATIAVVLGLSLGAAPVLAAGPGFGSGAGNAASAIAPSADSNASSADLAHGVVSWDAGLASGIGADAVPAPGAARVHNASWRGYYGGPRYGYRYRGPRPWGYRYGRPIYRGPRYGGRIYRRPCVTRVVRYTPYGKVVRIIDRCRRYY